MPVVSLMMLLTLRYGYDTGYWSKGACVGGGMVIKGRLVYMGSNNISVWRYFFVL